MTSMNYEIRVTGIPPAEALADFEFLMASVEPVETVLHGPLSDQAALSDLLGRLELLGAEVVEIRRLRGGPGAPGTGDAPGPGWPDAGRG
ncbi:MAG TPA: hypothetical protein VMI33_23535 [Streptosporangiaceae bacterium]|nr:hypothetical protein [Streptosporangiaceae bacterium]